MAKGEVYLEADTSKRGRGFQLHGFSGSRSHPAHFCYSGRIRRRNRRGGTVSDWTAYIEDFGHGGS